MYVRAMCHPVGTHTHRDVCTSDVTDTPPSAHRPLFLAFVLQLMHIVICAMSGDTNGGK